MGKQRERQVAPDLQSECCQLATELLGCLVPDEKGSGPERTSQVGLQQIAGGNRPGHFFAHDLQDQVGCDGDSGGKKPWSRPGADGHGQQR